MVCSRQTATGGYYLHPFWIPGNLYVCDLFKKVSCLEASQLKSPKEEYFLILTGNMSHLFFPYSGCETCTCNLSQASLQSLQLRFCFFKHASSSSQVDSLPVHPWSCRSSESLLRALFLWIVLFLYRHSSRSSIEDYCSQFSLLKGTHYGLMLL